MPITPVMPYNYMTSAQKIVTPQKPQVQPKSPEAFEGEGKLLKEVYDSYMKNAGGFQNINGQRVHVTTVLHIDKSAQMAALAVEKRLQELGILLPPQNNTQMIY